MIIWRLKLVFPGTVTEYVVLQSTYEFVVPSKLFELIVRSIPASLALNEIYRVIVQKGTKYNPFSKLPN